MKLRIVAVGRMNNDLRAAEQRYLKYLRPYADVALRELPQGRGRHAEQRIADEEQQILKHVTSGFILFDVQGKSMRSEQWSEYLGRASANAIEFVIGGPDGVGPGVRGKAAERWSLSSLTLPHQLVRVLVLEQLYRATSMLHGHPYHRG